LAPQADAVAYVHDVRQCMLCGVEIIEGAEPVPTHLARTPSPSPSPNPCLNPNPNPNPSPSPKPSPKPKPKPKPKPESKQVPGHPFRGSTAFLMGNEGHGLTDAQIAVCDHFVYIPQVGGT